MSFPEEPGWKGTETSRAAAEFVAPSAGRMMDRIEALVAERGPMSPEEITEALWTPDNPILLNSVRARATQLKRLGRATDSGLRGLGESRKVRVIRIRVTTPDERSLFLARKAAEDEHGETPHG